jgi:hypothetical protein
LKFPGDPFFDTATKTLLTDASYAEAARIRNVLNHRGLAHNTIQIVSFGEQPSVTTMKKTRDGGFEEHFVLDFAQTRFDDFLDACAISADAAVAKLQTFSTNPNRTP